MAEPITRSDNPLSASIKINNALAEIKDAALDRDEAIDFRGSSKIASRKIETFLAQYLGIDIGQIWAMNPEEFVEAISMIYEYIPPTGFVFLVDGDGSYLIDTDGSYLLDAA